MSNYYTTQCQFFAFNLEKFTPGRKIYMDTVPGVLDKYQVCLSCHAVHSNSSSNRSRYLDLPCPVIFHIPRIWLNLCLRNSQAMTSKSNRLGGIWIIKSPNQRVRCFLIETFSSTTALRALWKWIAPQEGDTPFIDPITPPWGVEIYVKSQDSRLAYAIRKAPFVQLI